MGNLKKKKKNLEQGIRFVLTIGGFGGKADVEKGGQKVQTSNYKTNKY